MKNYIHRISLGQSLVEFALILPAFVLLTIVIFDLGRGIYYYSSIHNAAREGARYGIIHPDDFAGMQAKAVKYAIGLGITTANVNAGPGTPENVGDFPNPTVKITVSYCFIPATPLVESILPKEVRCSNQKQIYLSSDAIMRTETLP